MTAVLKLVDAVPSPPKRLSAVGRAEWRRVASIMAARGTLRDEILSTLEAYCTAVSQHRQYADEAAGVPCFVTTPEGRIKTHPAHSLLAQALKQVGVYSKVLGLAVGSKGRALSEDVETDRARWHGCEVE